MSEHETSPAPVRKPAPTLKSLLAGEQFKAEIARALPKHLTADRFVRIALTALTRTPKLMECEQAGFFEKLLTLSQLGLEPDGRRAHLIPFYNSKRQVTECQLIIDYKGLVELAMRGGEVSNIHADVVCENDEFEYDLGEIKKHRIDFKKPRGEVYAAYAMARFRDGALPKCEVLHYDEIEAVRKRSRAGQSGPWVTDWREMAKKTAFRRLSKWLPLSPELRDAADMDDDRFDNAKIIHAEEVPQASQAAKILSDKAAKKQEEKPPETSTVDPALDRLMTEGNQETPKDDENQKDNYDDEDERAAIVAEILKKRGRARGPFLRAIQAAGVEEGAMPAASADKLREILQHIENN